MNINFSFIIPHRNSPDSLKRCIDSIPTREDVQIIVVDDNSDNDKKPQVDRAEVEVVLLDASQSKGAGRARNVGLKHAKGNWVLFIDCDDTYTENLVPFLEKYKDSDVSVVYFNYNKVIGNKVERDVCKCLNSSTENAIFDIKYKITMPWNKMVKYSFITDNNIAFEECPVGNDIFYTYQVGYFAKEDYKIEDVSLYNYIQSTGSITRKKKNNKAYYLTICKHIYQCSVFYKFVGARTRPKTMMLKFGAVLKKKGLGQFFSLLWVYISQFNVIKNDSGAFVESIKKRI